MLAIVFNDKFKDKFGNRFGFRVDPQIKERFLVGTSYMPEKTVHILILDPEFAIDLAKAIQYECKHYESDFYAWNKKRTAGNK